MQGLEDKIRRNYKFLPPGGAELNSGVHAEEFECINSDSKGSKNKLLAVS
jgi:hypothetical protein